MPSLTRWVLAHKRTVVLFWIVTTIIGIATVNKAVNAMDQKFSVPGKESWETNVKITQLYGGTGGDTAPIVPVVTLPHGKTVSSPGVQRQLAAADRKLEQALPGSRLASYASTGDSAFVALSRSKFAVAAAGKGRPRRKPWTVVQPRLRRRSTCAARSPSAS